MAYTNIGNTVIEWDDHEPLIFTMSENTGPDDDRRQKNIKINISGLRPGFEDEFLVNLKNIIIERRNHVALITIEGESHRLWLLLRRTIDRNLFQTKRSVIDDTFLLALNSIIEEVPAGTLRILKRYFNFNPYSPIFKQGLKEEDFPNRQDKRKEHGRLINSILGKALTRSVCIDILNKSEQAYEDGIIDIGLFSFIHLAFCVYVRPESYRQIRVSDLVHDTQTGGFFLFILPAKSGVYYSRKISYPLNRHVGMLLLKQRQHVIHQYGHLVAKEDIGKLALFPCIKLSHDKSRWVCASADKNFGASPDANRFNNLYFYPIRGIVLGGKYSINATVLRHTAGTQLAQAGCHAQTIKAVLKHASDSVCNAYVDIIFHGLIDNLSDAMQPAFEAHMPVFKRFRSKGDLVTLNKAIHSEDLETGQTEFTGECGSQIGCEGAPLTCYECSKFIPCFDADHSINLEIIEREIERYKNAGTAYQHLVEKAKSIKYSIQLVMAVCDRHHQAVAEQEAR